MTDQRDSERTGLLLAMMEPPPAMAEEFQDWYDTEHFPERAGTEGFVTAHRFVCLEGFPRYLALYDLSSLAVMDGPGYAAIARNRYSLWTKRIIPRVWGHYRAEATQVYPGQALLGSHGAPVRLMLWRFRDAPVTARDSILSGVSASFTAPAMTQLRLFEGRPPADTDQQVTDFLVTAEFSAPVSAPPPNVEAFGGALRYLDVANIYTPYWR